MTKPQRYGASAAPCDSGIFVMYAEYEKVAAECERLRTDAQRWATYMRLFSADAGQEIADALLLAIDAARAKEQS